MITSTQTDSTSSISESTFASVSEATISSTIETKMTTMKFVTNVTTTASLNTTCKMCQIMFENIEEHLGNDTTFTEDDLEDNIEVCSISLTSGALIRI